MMLLMHSLLSITSLASQHPKYYTCSIPFLPVVSLSPTRLWARPPKLHSVRPPPTPPNTHFVRPPQLHPSLSAGFCDLSYCIHQMVKNVLKKHSACLASMNAIIFYSASASKVPRFGNRRGRCGRRVWAFVLLGSFSMFWRAKVEIAGL